MKIRLKVQFLPTDYEIQMYQKVQNMRQKDMSISAYTEEFNKMSIRARRQEEELEKVARYLNGLRQRIQDEITMLSLDNMHKHFQMALREEDKARRRNESYQRGRCNNNKGFRGRHNYGREQGPNKANES